MSQKKKSWKTVGDLTDRQRLFVAKYAQTGNAAHAARAAGYAAGSARKTGSRLLTYGYIRQALKCYAVEQLTQCMRPLRRALRNLDRDEVGDWDIRSIQKLLSRLISVVEFEGAESQRCLPELMKVNYRRRMAPDCLCYGSDFGFGNVEVQSSDPECSECVEEQTLRLLREHFDTNEVKSSVIARRLRRY